MWSPHSLRQAAQSSLYCAILQDIMSGKLARGKRLVEDHLARTYQVSRTPVREVLMALQGDGLVERLPNRGARVASFTARDVEELFEIRKALEVHCIPRVIQTASLSELLELEHQLETLDRGSGAKWRQEHAQLDLKLHHLIISRAENRRLSALMGSLSLLIESLQVAGFRNRGSTVETGRQHLAIVRGLLSHESETTQRLLAEHIEFGKRNALALFFHAKTNHEDAVRREAYR